MSDTLEVELVGPFEEWVCTVGGRKVPYLAAHPQSGGKVLLTLDGRFGLEVDVADMDRVVEFVANAIAVASGIASAARPDLARNQFPRLIGLESATAEDSEADI